MPIVTWLSPGVIFGIWSFACAGFMPCGDIAGVGGTGGIGATGLAGAGIGALLCGGTGIKDCAGSVGPPRWYPCINIGLFKIFPGIILI